MLVKTFKILLVFFFFVINTAKGQEYMTEVTSYTVEDGLSSRFLRWMYEDSRGFVWFATENGINRFDGHDFKVFTKENSNLFSNSCYRIVEDNAGNIWVGFKYTGSSNFFAWRSIITPEFEIIDFDVFFKEKLSFSGEKIRTVHRVGTELILICDQGEVYSYDQKFTKIASNEQLETAMVLGRDDAERLYFQTEYNYLIVENETVKIKEKPGVNFSPVLKSGEVYWYDGRTKLEDPLRRKLISKKDTLPMVPIDFFPGEQLPPTPLKLFYDDYLTRCFHYEDLLKQLEPTFDSHSYRQRYFSEQFPEMEQGAAIPTKDGNFWFWNLEGVHFASFSRNRFQNIFPNKNYSTRSIYPIEARKLMTSSHEGIFEFDPETGDFKKKSKESIPSRGVVKLKNGEFLLGDYGSTVHRFNLENGEVSDVFLNKKDYKTFPGKGFLTPFGDASGNVWVGTNSGLVEYDFDTNLTAVFRKYNQFTELQKAKMSFFREYDDGIWGASSAGLFVLKPEEGIVAFHQPLPDITIEHFYREDTIFWLATYGKGLVRWNSKTGKTWQFGLENGLLDENLMAVYPDENNHLWVTTNIGLARFDRNRERFQVFLKSDGISHNEFNISSHYQDKNGKLFFGGLNGITAFHPKEFYEEEKGFTHSFVITEYEEISSKTLESIDKTHSFLKANSISLLPDIQTFKLRFALLNFENIKQTRYAYKIEGLENEWTFQDENYIKFSRLPYGKYTLRLKAIDFRGTVSEEIEIPLEIIASFYKQLRWQILAGLLGVGFVFMIFKRRQQVSNQEREKLERIVSERTKELKSLNETKDRLFAILAHDLRNPVIAFEELSETINYLMQKNEVEEVEKLGNYIEIEAKQLHHLLDNLLNWAMAQREELPIHFLKINVTEFVAAVVKNYKHLEARTNVEILTDIAPDLYILSDRRVLETVFRNIITNAFRYTEPGGHIKIVAYQENGKVIIDFSDSGVGMTERELENLFDIKQRTDLKGSTSTVSLGMHLCRELIELVNGEISAKSTIGKGALITIKTTVYQ